MTGECIFFVIIRHGNGIYAPPYCILQAPCLLSYKLFSVFVSSSDYTLSNDRMISDHWIRRYVEGIGRHVVVGNFTTPIGIIGNPVDIGTG